MPVQIHNYRYGRVLKTLRISKGLKQIEVAEALKISTASVRNHETNTTHPELSTLSSYCNFYNLEIYEFFHLLAFSQDSTIKPIIVSDISELAALSLLTN